ncbi:hypothetical protein [Mycobacteroides saopaulense]|uniref:hypothetical protein n=1 Tax=Mycobacteroides saopaulense TaxID=1578165 RepID=UPI00090EFD29|nr:hypothetical protein [Mycobacteroides saopaulense]OHT86926.1 hypothetical protein BKG68_12655 [Mycobacteroides saopaulense]
MSELVDRAKASLEGVTRGPWKWSDYRVPDLLGRAGDPDSYEYDTEVLETEHGGECGCRSSCALELNVKREDREFIAAARQLVPELIAEVEQARSYRSLPPNMVWQDYYSPNEVIALREEIEHWKSLWQGTVEDSTKVIQERDEALREVEKLRRAVDVLKYDNRMGLDYE